MIYTHVLARPDIRVVSPLDRLEMPEVKKVPEVQELGASVVSSLESAMGREMKKGEVVEEVAERGAKSESAEEVTMAERRGTRRNEKVEGEEITTAERRGTLKNEKSEKSGEEEVTTAVRRGTLICESDFASLSSDASDARTQATRDNWIQRAGVVFARIVCSARRFATGVSSNSA